MQKWEKDFGIRIMKKRIDEDQTVYAFSYETTSVNINDALCDLQKILPEWEAVIIQEIAYEQSLNGMMRSSLQRVIRKRIWLIFLLSLISGRTNIVLTGH